MSDASLDRIIRFEAEALVDAVSRRWSADMMKDINDDMKYGQYSEAVLDIVATSYKKKSYLRKNEIGMVRSLVNKMGIERDLMNTIDYVRSNVIYNDEMQSNLATLSM